jgi:beta-lactam-binding protein with PASTA domain
MKKNPFAFLALLLATFATLAPMQVRAAATVSSYELVSSVRNGRTLIDYTYRIRVANGTPALTQAVATVSSNNSATSVVDATVNLGSLAANVTETSVDTFTIRQDRTLAFNPASLTWNVTGSVAAVVVPNVVGQTQANATSTLVAAALSLGSVTQQTSASVPAGSVISQVPAAGASVSPGSGVNLTVSSGPPNVQVPNVVGQTLASANSAIMAAGLTTGVVTQQGSVAVPAGSVIAQSPFAGASVAPSSAVNLVVSSGPPNVQVPNVVGQTQASAMSALTAAGLTSGAITSQASGAVPAGTIISQSPAAGASVAPGTPISLVVSSGPAVAQPLPGSPAALASSAAYDLIDAQAANGIPAIMLSSGRVVSSRLITIGTTATATAGDINALITSINGRIVGMQSGTGIFVLLIPQSATTAALESLVAQLGASPSLEFADFARLAGPSALPVNTTPAAAEAVLGAQIAARGPALWNLREAYIPALAATLVVADCFENGTPGVGFGGFDLSNVTVNDFELTQVSTCGGTGHGYTVLGMATADFGGGGVGLVTGMIGGSVDLRVVEYFSIYAPWENVRVAPSGIGDLRLVRRLREISGPIVLNTSIGMRHAPLSEAEAGRQARYWLRLLRGDAIYFQGQTSEIEQRMLHISAAGNVPFEAVLNSAYAAAAKMSNLRTVDGLLIPNQLNALVVENRALVSGSRPPTRACALDPTSGREADVSAIGAVVSYNDPGFTLTQVNATSFAAPQVAGLAVWLSGLPRRFSIPQIKNLITGNAYAPCEEFTQGSDMVDAFGTALATDNDVPLPQANVHRALLDVVTREPVPDYSARIANGPSQPTPDGRFTEYDVAHVALELLVANGALDYSRYDLNGDGATGGSGEVPFDLDRNGQVTTTPMPGVPGLQIDEEHVSDAEALCYFTLSEGLFEQLTPTSGSANVDVRRMVLLPLLGQCGIRLERVFVQAGGSTGAVAGAREWTMPASQMNTFSTAAFHNGTWLGNIPTCNQRGSPAFSSRVPSGAIRYGATGTSNASVPIGEFGNRLNCSAFIAVSGLRIWGNLVARKEIVFPVSSDIEFQTRFYYGADGTPQAFETGLNPTPAYLAHVPVVNPSAAGYVERRGASFTVSFEFVRAP